MSAAPKATVHFRSLGCAKNLLDTEVMLGTLATRGYAIAESLEDADVAVVNTCSFIDSAREESVQAILEVADLRESGRLRGLVVAGCMPQRYGAALAVSEIVNNSIEHVKGKGPGGYHEVDFTFGIDGGRAVGTVLDEGTGGIAQKDFETAFTPTLENDRGRGLYLIRAYVDELTVREIPGVGTEIRFVKNLGAGAEGGA